MNPAPMTAAELERLAALLTDAKAVEQFLPPEEVAEYRRCQQSVIDARRYAERMAPFMWIG